MLHPSTKKLIDKLSEMTRRQRVSWLQGEDGKIYHDTEGFRVILTPEPHQVLITDALGKAIESAADAEFAGITDAHNRPYAQFVAELYREADRCARGAERAIDLLLKGLDRTDETAEPPAPPVVNTLPEDIADERLSTFAPSAEPSVDVQGITDAVASLADEVNAAAETAPPPVLPDDTTKWVPVAGAAVAAEAHAELSADQEETLAPLESPAEAPAPDTLPPFRFQAPPLPASLQPAVQPAAEEPEPALASGYEEVAGVPETGDADALALQDLQAPEPEPEPQILTMPEPVASPPPAPEPMPAPPAPAPAPQRYPQFGNYGRPFTPAPGAPPAPPPTEAVPTEPVVAMAAPNPPPAPVPAPTPAPTPMNMQRFSLSGLGYGASARPDAPPAPPQAPAPTPAPSAPPEVEATAAPPSPTPPAPEPAAPLEPPFQFASTAPPAPPAETEPAARQLFPTAAKQDAGAEANDPEPTEAANPAGRQRRFNPWQ
jgi:hypothetical protein